MPTALAISPHLDDAAFSCGGTLATLAQAGWRVVICTVFTASVPKPTGFALACQLDKGLSAEIDYMALRRGEDSEAAAALGAARPVWLPFSEAPHRGYDSAKALFGDLRPEDRVSGPVSTALQALLEAETPDVVLAPQAIGGHVDHVQVFRALARLTPASPVLFWQDFPYLIRDASPLEPFRTEMAAFTPFDVRLSPAALARKRAACRSYASQLGFQFGGVAGLEAALTDREGFRAKGVLPADVAVIRAG